MYEVLAPEVLYFPSFLSDHAKFIETVNATSAWSEWKPNDHSISGFSYGTLKTFGTHEYRDIVEPLNKNNVRYIVNTVKKVNLICGYEYLKSQNASHAEIDNFKKSVLLDKITIGIKKYRENGPALGPHPDTDLDNPRDEFSITFYPNDAYEGGELNFPDIGVSVKPKAGSVVVYPSKHIHESLPVSSGEKYVTNYVYLAAEKLWK
jgi:hypothetical protein